jgi:hypothetical protein
MRSPCGRAPDPTARLQLQSCAPVMKPRRNRLVRPFDGITFLAVEIE